MSSPAPFDIRSAELTFYSKQKRIVDYIKSENESYLTKCKPLRGFPINSFCLLYCVLSSANPRLELFALQTYNGTLMACLTLHLLRELSRGYVKCTHILKSGVT